MEREKNREVAKELEDHRKNQERLREQELENRLRAERSTMAARASSSSSSSKKSQSKLLLGAVKRSNSSSQSNGPPPQKAPKKEEKPPPPPPPPLGALAGLGDYSSSDEES